MRWQDYQLSRLELTFAVIILLIVLTAMLNRAVTYFSMAERALVNNVVTNINTALRLREAAYHASGQSAKIATLAGSNPVELIASRPENYAAMVTGDRANQALLNVGMSRPLARYIGEFDNPQPSAYRRGSWYYDTGEGHLVYMVRNREYFATALPGPARMRFRIDLEYRDRNDNGRYDETADELLGVKLKPVDEHEWLL